MTGVHYECINSDENGNEDAGLKCGFRASHPCHNISFNPPVIHHQQMEKKNLNKVNWLAFHVNIQMWYEIIIVC